MDYAEYQQRVLGRASHRWHNDKLDIDDLKEVLSEFCRVGNQLDRIKKALMYGREFYMDSEGDSSKIDKPAPMIAVRDQQLVHAMLGIATEGVEMIEAVQAFFFGGEPFDDVNLQEEFGDTEWYRAFGLKALGQTHEANLAQNDAKLELRFGPGQVFSEQAANERDLDAERTVLEGRE